MKTKMARGANPKYQLSQDLFPRIKGAIVNDTMLMSFINMFNAGPEVSLNGSPTVSPTTQALPCSVFLIFNFSQSFLELSHAPPALDIMMPSIAPETIAPARSPIRHAGPTKRPTKIGAKIAYAPGAIISFTLDRVEIFTHLLLSGSTSSSSGISPM